ncbi:MAG: hypothetical protein Q9188_002192 [Gyalolechia gomerana]
MPMATNPDPSPPPFHVPTVDISAFLADSNSSAGRQIIADIRQACRSTGFFQVTGHGIPSSLQKEIFDAAATFFKLPFDEKKKLDAKTTIGHRGYDVLASQSYEPDVMPDLKEGFYIGCELPLDSPLVEQRRFFMGSNVWPPSSLLPASSFQVPAEKYYTAIYNLSLTVIDLIARTLPYGPDVFQEFVANTPAAPLRLLHYPAAPPTTAKRQLGASAHTDFGAITLLLQDENPGLEILDANTNQWVEIAPHPDAYVVNVGDMLSSWTSNEYKSSVHRVINKNPWDRYSVVFFFDGNLDCKLAPMDGSPEEVGREGLTVEGHMLRRMAESYGSKE